MKTATPRPALSDELPSRFSDELSSRGASDFLSVEESSSETSPSRRWGQNRAAKSGSLEEPLPPDAWLAPSPGPEGSAADDPLQAIEKAMQESLRKCLPTDEDELRRTTTLDRLRDFVHRGLNVQDGDVSLHRFGSAASGFGERGSDLDVAVELQCSNGKIKAELQAKKITDFSPIAKGCIVAVAREIAQSHVFQVVGRILSAKVPLLMLRDKETGLSCDLSFGNLKGVTNTALLHAYAELDERLVHVVLVVKRWAKAMGVSGSKRGYLSSYSLTLMVIFFFQVSGELPSLQQHSEADAYFLNATDALGRGLVNRSGRSAAELLLAFFDFYYLDFSWGGEVVSVRLGERRKAMDREFMLLKHRTDRESIHIEDPFELERNLNCVLYGPQASDDLKMAMDGARRHLHKGKLHHLFTHTCNWCSKKIRAKDAGEGQEEEGGREDETTDMWYCDGCWSKWEQQQQRQRSAKKANKYPLPQGEAG